MVISVLTGSTTPKTLTTIVPEQIDSSVVRQIENRKSPKEINDITNYEEYVVRESFKEDPILSEIAFCESRYEQLDSKGNIIKNKKSSAVGVMQIMASIHEEDAKDLGMDIYTLEGNLGYAKHLYGKYGTKPWNSSKSCWGKYEGKDLAINR